jgi:uncharacterized protein DUF6884
MTYLIACVSRKIGYPAQAQYLYSSDLLLKARKFVGKNPWFILSAKYGLVPPRKVIAPYENTLLQMSQEERKKWSERVLIAIKKNIPISETLVVLADARYREFLLPALESCGYSVEVPMIGLPLGKQLRWLTRPTARRSGHRAPD